MKAKPAIVLAVWVIANQIQYQLGVLAFRACRFSSIIEKGWLVSKQSNQMRHFVLVRNETDYRVAIPGDRPLPDRVSIFLFMTGPLSTSNQRCTPHLANSIEG